MWRRLKNKLNIIYEILIIDYYSHQIYDELVKTNNIKCNKNL